MEEVKKLDLFVNGVPLVANCDYSDKAQREVETKVGTYYIASGTDNKKRKEF